MALKRRDYFFEWHVDIGRHAITIETKRPRDGCGIDVGGAARVCRKRPDADPEIRQLRPGKELARIFLSRRRHIGMAEHTRGRNGMALRDVAGEIEQRRDLRFGKWHIAKLVARIDDLDADRAPIDVALAGPIGDARMPRAELFVHMAIDAAVAIDRVVSRDFRLRIAETRE